MPANLPLRVFVNSCVSTILLLCALNSSSCLPSSLAPSIRFPLFSSRTKTGARITGTRLTRTCDKLTCVTQPHCAVVSKTARVHAARSRQIAQEVEGGVRGGDVGVVEPGRGSDGTCLKQQREAGREAVVPHRTGGTGGCHCWHLGQPPD